MKGSGALAAAPLEGSQRLALRLPAQSDRLRFSDLPIAAAIMAKPAVDAFYEVDAVKYAYMLFIVFAALFALVGRMVSGLPGMAAAERRAYARHAVLFAVYLIFLLVLLAVHLGSLSEVFKILSPFLLFLLLAPVAGPWTLKVIGLMSLVTILANSALLPLDRGWVYWGDIRTFKGLYYFKTDLAYTLVFSTLALAAWQRFRLTPLLVLGMSLATVQIVLANSRLNYLLFALAVVVIVVKSGIRPRTLARNGLLLAILVAIAAYLYDPAKLLGFDLFNEAKFTQGRNQIWDVMVGEGLLNYSALEWLFGKGFYADLRLFAENVSKGEAHNAHNEWLHLLITQGLFGTVMYLALWGSLLGYLQARTLEPWGRGLPTLAISLFLLQSMTAVVSAFASKTWPLLFVLMAAVCARPLRPGPGDST